MSDYTLYYWPVPFRGEFIRTILAHAGKAWDEPEVSTLVEVMEEAPGDQPVPFMGPPVLVDRAADFTVSQMPAVALYLGDILGLLPSSPQDRAMTLKIVADANDVIDEITLNGGREMWTPATWMDFVPRLRRWMSIFEATGQRHGLQRDHGLMLGGGTIGVADIVTATLWSTLRRVFPGIGTILDETAPGIAALSRRVWQTPALAAWDKESVRRYGDSYCGGQIEKSLKKSVNG
ncbi:glutathione S-transferase family protein [Nitrospirillum viridazoti]|uniref:Glutathione S-transferase n=1 Tax=Nitrospirillum viridazoti CBAmc TaxID=1441467 RepID=A0A248JSN0_9PROT|nr:glutathione S-transferase [Nitrospirillum amazonense]ASG21685.1 glutathione S-transferase [Nitrospirillum amazonense CBAmc]TWB42154.1 glutathione S-transferase [Nitrospirillum amazonense]